MFSPLINLTYKHKVNNDVIVDLFGWETVELLGV